LGILLAISRTGAPTERLTRRTIETFADARGVPETSTRWSLARIRV
jgi:hypothetical protein